MISQNQWCELIVVGYNANQQLTIQRHLIDRMVPHLLVREMIWGRFLSIDDYIPFILRDNALEYVSYTYDITSCLLNGPIIVAISIQVREPHSKIIAAINRTQILKQRR